MRSRGFTAIENSPASSAATLEEPVFSSTAGSKLEPITTYSKPSFSSPVLEPTPLAKRGLDVALSATGLVLATPLGGLIALAIKLGDGGPVFFAQDRVGKAGKPFRSFKFRSMILNADGAEGPVQAQEHDPRVTPIGQVLRKTAMDELPQLWNIFRGDMSFVGPRALATHEAETGGGGNVALSDIPGYGERHAVVPGLTGIAQIYARRDISRRRKFRFDRLYVDHRSFWLDLKLIFLSFWITFRGKWEVREKKL